MRDTTKPPLVYRQTITLGARRAASLPVLERSEKEGYKAGDCPPASGSGAIRPEAPLSWLIEAVGH